MERLKREIRFLVNCVSGDIDIEKEDYKKLRNEFDNKYKYLF